MDRAMTEPTITCPHCKIEIRLTESLAAPLIDATRKQFEQRLAQKDAEIAQREQGVREMEKQIAETKRTLNEQIADQVAAQLKSERARLIADEARKAKPAWPQKTKHSSGWHSGWWRVVGRYRPSNARSSARWAVTPSW